MGGKMGEVVYLRRSRDWRAASGFWSDELSRLNARAAAMGAALLLGVGDDGTLWASLVTLSAEGDVSAILENWIREEGRLVRTDVPDRPVPSLSAAVV
jgi:hypothetical protein